jgi:hypothetical protein
LILGFLKNIFSHGFYSIRSEEARCDLELWAFNLVVCSFTPATSLTSRPSTLITNRNGGEREREYYMPNWRATSRGMIAAREAVQEKPVFILSLTQLWIETFALFPLVFF